MHMLQYMEAMQTISCRAQDLQLASCSSSSKQCMSAPCSAERKEQTIALPAAMTVALGAALSSPLAAQAAVTPSLKNLINSVIAGGVVLGVIVAGVTAVSGFDPVTRGK